MSQLMKKRFPSITSIDVESDGNTSFLRAARNGQLDKVLEHLKSNIDINTSNANGLNALHLASKDGHVEIVEELLKRGAVVDAATKKGNTALHIASLAGQEEVVKLLVQHGASVNVQSQNGFTPLYMAAQENHDNVVKYLLANGANQSLSTEDGFTPLAVAMQQGHEKVVTVLLENDTRGKIRLPALHIAAKKDDVKAAKLLLENEHNPDVTSKSGFTPLHIASHYGNQQIANLLIQKGADVNYAAKHNITPLHVAAKWGKTNMVALLLEHGATIESKTRDGLTPLHCAARSGHEQVVDMLLERGAPISSKTKNGLAPLHMAAQGDHVDAARILLYHRAPVDEVTVDYLTALHVAAHCGHVRVAKLLLDRQADANARALNGFTPLHIACKKNRIKVVELLLKHGASIGATTESGLTPLHVASFMGCMNIVIYLLQHDANPDVPTVRGETPLHLAARANQTDIIRILLRNGAQVDARAREQQTPLHIASRLGNVDIVMLLLQHGAKVDNTTKDMYTALHIAAKEGQDEVAAVLLDNGASLDATTKKGFTPLHLAAKYGHLKVAKLLLQKEAPVDAQGKNGVTPLHVASHYDHQNVALLLLDKGASPHATAKNGHTPLHIAARKNQMDIANTLLEYGAQPNAESKAGFTPLHLSAQEGHADMSSLLLEHKADANFEAKNGLTPLHLCAQEDRVPVAEILVKNGADINSATKGGYTPLHIASHYGQTNMVRFLLQNGANVKSTTSLDYTPLHQAAQQGHANIVNILLENSADPNALTTNGQTPLNIAQKLGYITVIETLKVVTTTTTITTTTTTNIEEKYRVQAPELMHETFMSDSEEEGGEDTVLGDQTYKYLTADEMKSLGDDSLPIDVTRDERIDSNRMVSSGDSNMLPPQHIEDNISPEHVTQNYVEYIKKYTPDNVDVGRHPISIGFLVSFLVDARGGAMRGCRHSGVRVIVPPRCAPSPTRITCRYVRPQRTPHPPPLMEGEALASRVLELGPVGAKFLGPVIIEVPHFAALRGKEREIVILRSDNGESWKEHTVEATEEVLNEVLHDSFEAEDLNQLEDMSSGRITRILTQDFPQYFAVVSRIRQEVHAIGPEGGMVSSTVVPQVQAVFPEGALTKKIKVGLQAQPIDPELTAKLLGHGVAVSPVVTVEPRRRKFHKAITLSMPAPRAHSQGMINQYSGSAPTLRLLCSITGGTTRAQWEDVTGSTPLTFVNDCVSFTTTVSARFWLMDCRNIGDATKMATELYKEAIHVPFMAKFVVFAKRVDPLEARLRVFCMTDDKEDKTLEHQEHFTEVAKSRDVEVLEGKLQYVEFAGNLVPITKSGEHLSFSFRAFRENRLPFSVRVKDQHAEAVSRCLFMKEAKVPKGEPPQQPICILNIVLPDDIVTDTISLTDTDSVKKHTFLSENFDYYRPDPRLADMSNLLGEDWVPLANQLGLTTSEINVIKSEYPDSVAKQAQCMLRMWLSQSGNKAQTNTLENALRRIEREDIIPQCLNVDHTGQTITRIKQEEIGKYRLKKDIGIIDTEVVTKNDISDERLMADKQDVKRKLDSYDKYSAEEKEIEVSDEEEEAFDKPVAERREQIEKRLSAERTIPASSQRREIVQEITSIKRQSIVEDKIAEVQQKTIPEPKTTLEQTKTTPEQTKYANEQIKTTTSTIITVSPEIKTVFETVEVKTTIPSDSKVSETVKIPSLEKIHENRTTTAIETRTIQPEETPHRTTDDAELLEGVTQSLENTKKPISKLIADEDPKSPKFSKTPPPSPADFLIREQVATVKEWDASSKPVELEPKTVGQVAAKQGKTTSTTHYLVINEELSLVQLPVDATSTGLSARDDNLVDLNPIYYQTNAFIQSESRAEPYHCHTAKYYRIDQENEDKKLDLTQTISAKDEKKRKKGILGTIKTFVGKSLEHSDSESEKSPKKEKKNKKEKKGTKTSDGKLPLEIPVRPVRKPKLPTPTEDYKYADIPYFEASPSENENYKSAEISTRESTPFNEKEEYFKLSEVALNSAPITNLDDTETNVPENIKNQATEIVIDVIRNSEKAVTEELLQKSPKSKKRKVIIVEETVFKTFTPASVEEEEFTIIIDPTMVGSPKKTRETFTLNIDESINKIEKEILEKSPILPDEKLIKPSVQIEDPVRAPRNKDHVYEDIEERRILHHDNFDVLPEYFNFPHPDDIKTATTDLINNEIEFTGWQDDKYNLFNVNKLENKEELKEKVTDSQRIKRKHGKLFALFGKMSKDGDDSEEDSKKEVIEKHDKETSKEQKAKIEVEKSPKLKKSKSKENPEKIEAEVSDMQISPKKTKGKDKEEKRFLSMFKKGKKDNVEVKPAFSESAIKEMIDSIAFLKEEVDKYHDVKLMNDAEHITYQLKNKIESKMRIIERNQNLSEATLTGMQNSDSFLKEEVKNYYDLRPIINRVDAENKQIDDKNRCMSSTIWTSKEKVSKLDKTKDELVLSAYSRDMNENHRTEVNAIKKQNKNKAEQTRPIGLFKKKTSVEREIEPKIEKTKDEPTLSQSTKNDMQNSESFLKDEVSIYHDVRPIIQCAVVREEEKTEISKSKHKEEGRGIFGLFKNKSSVDKEFEQKKEKTRDTLVFSEISTRNMQGSDSFLKDEVKIYHDVRPISIETAIPNEIKTAPEETKKEHKDDGKGGFFGLFKKKPSEERAIEQRTRPVLPENVFKDMLGSDSFLKDEIKIYHDVRPIIQESFISDDIVLIDNPKQEQADDIREVFGLFKNKFSEEKDTESKIEKIKERPRLSENKLRDMQETDSFLKDEVRIYHDVRPIIQEASTSTELEISKGEDKDGEKGLVGLFKKKDEKSNEVKAIQDRDSFLKDEIQIYHDVRPIIQASMSDNNTLSENTVKNMQETDSFLRNEIKLYHDVYPIIQETATLREVKVSSEKLKDKNKEDGTGFLGFFKKRSSEEKNIESKVEKIRGRLVLSDNTIRDMQETDAFLKDEIKVYHDVRPIIPETAILKEVKISSEKSKVKVKEDGKGLFGLFKRKSSEEKNIEPKVEKMKKRPVLSQNTIRDMQESDSFLRDEIKIYYDVRPIIQETTTIKEVKISSEKSKVKDKEDGNGLFRLFKKKSLEETNIEPKVEKIRERPVLSENIRDMQKTDSFLRNEVNIYHDVRPIIQDEVTLTDLKIKPKVVKTENQSILSDNTLRNMHETDSFLKGEIKTYHDVRSIIQEKTNPTKKPKKVEKPFFELSKKKASVEKEIIPKVQEIKHNILSENFPKDMHESDSFLKNEIKVYEDVRPNIEELISTKLPDSNENSKLEHRESETGFFRLFKNKSEDKETEEAVNEDTKHTLKSKKGKKNDLRKDVTEEHPLSSSAIKKISDTEVFLKEVDKYEDLPFTLQTYSHSVKTGTTEDTDNKEKGEKKKESKIIFGDKKQKDKEIEGETYNEVKNIHETTDFLNTELERYEDAKLTLKSNIDISVKIEQDSTVSETNVVKSGETSSKSGKLFGIFSKKKPQDRENSIEKDKKEEKQKLKLNAGDLPVIITKETKITLQQEMPTKPLDKSDSKNFPKGEIDRYHNAKIDFDKNEFSEMIQPETEEKIKEKSGFFGLFSKKTKPQEKIIERENSPTVIKNISDSDNFIRNEINKYEDSHPAAIPLEKVLEPVQDSSIKISSNFIQIQPLQGSIPTTIEETNKNTTETNKNFVENSNKSSKIEKISSVTTETITVKGTIQLGPHVLTDLCQLEEDIKTKIEEINDETKIRDVEKQTAQTEPELLLHEIPYSLKTNVSDEIHKGTDQVSCDEGILTLSDVKYLSEELKQHEDKNTVDKKERPPSGIFRIFKRKSQDREPSEEKYTDKSEQETNFENTKGKKEDRKKVGASFKIFGKQLDEKFKQNIENYENIKFAEISVNKEYKAHKQLNEEVKKEESKLTEVSEITLESIQNTKSFLSVELENYEDAKPEIITDLDEDVEQIKSSSLFGIFSKKDKSESPKVTKRKFKKSKKSVEEVGIIEKIGRKLTGASSDSNEYNIEDISPLIKENILQNIDYSEKTTEDVSKIEKCTKKEDFESLQKHLNTEHDIKLKKLSFMDAKDNIMENAETPEDKIGTVKSVTEKCRIAIETTSYDEMEFSGNFFSGIDGKIQKESEESNRTLKETVDKADQILKVQDTEKNDLRKVDVTQQTAQVVTEDYKDTVKETGGVFSKLGEQINSNDETVKRNIETAKTKGQKIDLDKQGSEDKNNDMKRHSVDSIVINNDILDNSECAKGARDTNDHKGKKNKKSKKSFFSKLGEKIGGKSDDVKYNTSGLKQNIADAKVRSEEAAVDITSGITTDDDKFNLRVAKTEEDLQLTYGTQSDELTRDRQSMKYDSSSFVSEIMQSFDDTLEHVRDSSKELKEKGKEDVVGLKKKGVENLEKIRIGTTKQTGTFLEQVDEKFSATMKLTEEMSLESKQKIKDSLQNTQFFLQNEKNDVEFYRTPLENMKYSSTHGATEMGDYFGHLGKFISEKTKEVESNVTETFDGTRMQKENVEEGIAIAVQNVDDVAEVSLSKGQEVKDSAIESYDIVKHIVGKTEDETEITKQTDIFLDAIKGFESSGNDLNTENEKIKKPEILADKSNSKINPDVEDCSEKTSKKSKRFLGKLGRKFSGKEDELKEKLSESPEFEETKISTKKHKKSSGFFGKLGEKIIGKSEESKHDADKEKPTTEEIINTNAGVVESHISASKAPIKAESDENKTDKPEIMFIKSTKSNFQDIKQATLDFIETECLHIDNTRITRTTSDYGSKIKDSTEQSPRKISEVNIDLSNLPANIDEYSKQTDKAASSYVTSPTLARRTVSQRFPKGERPEVIEVRNFDTNNISDDERYIVTEPDEIFKQIDNFHSEIENRKPLFHLESEEDNLCIINLKSERQDSTKSNILETLTELKIDSLISDLTKTLNEPLDIKEPLESDIRLEERRLEEHKKESEADVELIEKRLSDLDKALESLEIIDLQTEPDSNSDYAKTERKLRRVERKFERMASEVIDIDVKEGKEIQLTSPEIKDKQETEYRKLVSQLSTDEISDFQKEYSHLWDEHTFSKSDDWDSKTPDSQADAQELPQGGEEASSSTQQPSISHSIRAEGEEAEKEESGSERRVNDQHQLSDEMKELLKELEKESKQ